MTIKITSNIKQLMTEKGIQIGELREKTGLPHIAILNACSDKIEYTGLNVLSKIAQALKVPIKDLFEEKSPLKKQPISKKTMAGGTNISTVTNQLITYIMKLKTTDKDKLLEKYNELKKSPSAISDASNVTTNLVDLIMTMTLEERCKLLGDFISYSGDTKRKFSRQPYLHPISFTVGDKLYHANTKDISLGGVFIEIMNAKKLFNIDDPIRMNLEHPETQKHFNVGGRIVRIIASGMGVKFDEPL